MPRQISAGGPKKIRRSRQRSAPVKISLAPQFGHLELRCAARRDAYIMGPMKEQRSTTSGPVLRSFPLPNGDRIVSLRKSTLRAAVRAANTALKAERSEGTGSTR